MKGEVERQGVRESVARHYDSLALLYRLFWGEHVHHGFWPSGNEPLQGAPERLVEHLAERAQIRGGERVLDVGCGYGASGRWLARRFGCRVVGLTISFDQARYAVRRNAHQDSLTWVIHADAEALPFRTRSFDIVWVVECNEHLQDKPGFVAATADLLRPGGRLALCSWLKGARSGARAGSQVDEVCQRFLCPSLASSADYRRWCSGAGLRIERSEDLTGQVAKTWEVLIRRVESPWLRWLKPLLLDPAQLRFVEGFEVIRRAYSAGAMAYGLFVAVKG